MAPQTIRQEMISLLSQGWCSARDLSQTLRIQEKEVYSHLSHIARSMVSKHHRVEVTPPECLSCGYVFKDRKRFTRPSRCPRCKAERIGHPKYQII